MVIFLPQRINLGLAHFVTFQRVILLSAFVIAVVLCEPLLKLYSVHITPNITTEKTIITDISASI
jgi:hypothetical protein